MKGLLRIRLCKALEMFLFVWKLVIIFITEKATEICSHSD